MENSGSEVFSRAPVGGLGRSPSEAETLLLNERAIFNAPFMKIVKPVTHLTKVYCTRDIFSEIRTAHHEIPNVHCGARKCIVHSVTSDSTCLRHLRLRHHSIYIQ